MDQSLYEQAMDVEETDDMFLSKEMLYVIDSNSQSYSGQVIFDTSSLGNSDLWLSYKEGYVHIPFVITAKGAANQTAAMNGFVLGLKNGNHQIINSIQVDYGNVNVVPARDFSNAFISYKMLTSFSKDDVEKWSSTTGFYPDSGVSWYYSANAGVGGQGFKNNRVVPSADRAVANYLTDLEQSNDGLFERMQNTGYSNDATGLFGNFTSLPNPNDSAKSYYQTDSVAAAGRVYFWVVEATIRLRDLHSFFDQMPLVRGNNLRISINYNSCNTSIEVAGAGGNVSQTVNTMKSGLTNPLIFASNAPRNPSAAIAADTLSVQCGVVSTAEGDASAATRTPAFNHCRLYVPGYRINPMYEKQLISTVPKKMVTYEDIFYTKASNIGAGQSFNKICTNGIRRAKYLVAVPVISSINVGTTLPEYQSVFSTTPGTTSPLIDITNFNVQFGGRNVFEQALDYNFSHFLDEVSRVNALNGGVSEGLTSGLLSERDFAIGYKYLVADLSRRSEGDYNVPRSVIISGTNRSSQTIDLLIFIVQDKKIEVDMITGGVVGVALD